MDISNIYRYIGVNTNERKVTDSICRVTNIIKQSC